MKVDIKEVLQLDNNSNYKFGAVLTLNVQDGVYVHESRVDNYNLHRIEADWILFGDNNIRSLILEGIDWWNDIAYSFYKKSCKEENRPALEKENYIEMIKEYPSFAESFGDLGRIYGEQLRNWGDYASTSGSLLPAEEGYTKCNQIEFVFKNLKRKTKKEQLIFYFSNPSDIENSSVYPTQTVMQFYLEGENLDCCVYNRFCDLNTEFDILLPRSQFILISVAERVGLKPRFVHFQGGLFKYDINRSMIYKKVSIW